MIAIFKGPAPGSLDVADLTAASQFCADNAATLARGINYQERQDGVYQGGVKQSETISRISASLVNDDGAAVTLSDLPAGMGFGNGVTVNSQVTVAGIAGLTALSWAVFPDASADAVNTAWETLRGYFEG